MEPEVIEEAPNQLNPAGIYWLSTLKKRRAYNDGARHAGVPVVWAPSPVRGTRALRAAREAAAFIGDTVAIWSDGGGNILWTERPRRRVPTGRRLDQFTFIPED